jgi:hypothetical protein
MKMVGHQTRELDSCLFNEAEFHCRMPHCGGVEQKLERFLDPTLAKYGINISGREATANPGSVLTCSSYCSYCSQSTDMKLSYPFVSVLVSTLVSVAVGLQNGQITLCAAVFGGPAPRGAHLLAARNVTNGTLALGGFELVIDGVVVNPNATRTLETLKNYSVVVRGTTTGRQFRGAFLMLGLNGTDLSTNLLPLASYQRTPSCIGSGIAGVSHTENGLKNTFNGVLYLDAVRPIISLDVNIVTDNSDAAGSKFYYSNYRIASVVGTKAPVTPPVAPPVAPPVVSPTAPKAAAPTAPKAAAPTATAPVVAPTASTKKKCGLLGLRILCPLTRCGALGRALKLCKD